MKNLRVYPLRIISAEYINAADTNPTPLADYFVIVTYYEKHKSYMVWAEPDHNQAAKRLARLRRHVDSRNFDDTVETLERSHLPVNRPYLKPYKVGGMFAMLYAHQIEICAAFREEVARINRPKEIVFDPDSPPN
jgi:hypothetical protein